MEKKVKTEPPAIGDEHVETHEEFLQRIRPLLYKEEAPAASPRQEPTNVFDSEEDDFDEYYMLGLTLPKCKFIGQPKREYHIRVKLNDAPVKIWRELVVPSNITLELLAYVIIEAMGWNHEHLYHFIAKGGVFYEKPSRTKEKVFSLIGFPVRAQYLDSEKTSLEMLLRPKGERMRFEYDFGDSWMHDLWVKGERDYDPGEAFEIRLLKGQGACPPEDCGGVWGYASLLETSRKARKTAEEKECMYWYGITKDFHPEECKLEWLQKDVERLWESVKREMKTS